MTAKKTETLQHSRREFRALGFGRQGAHDQIFTNNTHMYTYIYIYTYMQSMSPTKTSRRHLLQDFVVRLESVKAVATPLCIVAATIV